MTRGRVESFGQFSLFEKGDTTRNWLSEVAELRIAIKGAVGVLGLAQPTNFTAAVGNAQVVLSWDPPASDSGVTRHEYQFKTGSGAYGGWERIANSGVGGANEAGFTVTGLTNEVEHTFQLRAVDSDDDESTAAEADPVTPTPGICGRTQKIQGDPGRARGRQRVRGGDMADLADHGFGGALGLATFNQGITSLQAGDFAGLTALTKLNLSQNQLTSLPEGIFSGLTAIEDINLNSNELTALPEGTFAGLTTLVEIDLGGNSLTAIPARAFSGLTGLELISLGGNDLTALPASVFNGLTALDQLYLSGNDLTTLPAGLFTGLASLTDLELQENDLVSLPAGLFTGLASLEDINLEDNDLNLLPDRLFNGLTALEILDLNRNDLSSLPDGLFSGLTGLTQLALDNNPNTDDVLPLTVTVEKFGTDQARAKVLVGAPTRGGASTATVVNGSLPTGVTKLAVAAGSVEGTPVTVTRTTGTMAAVTVDIDLSTQPTLPSAFTGYTFAKAASGLPAVILPDTRGPQNFTAKPGDGQAVLSWDRAGVGLGRDETPVPPEGGDRELRKLVRHPQQRGGRGERGRLHGAEPHQRDGVHLRAPHGGGHHREAPRRSRTR